MQFSRLKIRFKLFQRNLNNRISEYFLLFRATEHTFMIIIAVIIGLIGGLGAVGIQYSIRLVQDIFWGNSELTLDFLKTVPFYVKILAPTIGGVIVGAIVHFVAKEAKGHGVPEVMETIALRNGVIRPRVVFAKLFASAICIGSGGSTGREGPVIQIGSSVGSVIGQFLRVTPQRMKVFVACGAAAGIAAAFNAPVAGALFSIEIILGDFGVAHFSPIVISSVMATVVARFFLGNFPAFMVPHYDLVSPFELGPYAVLGILSGIVALIFIKVLYKFEDFFDEIKVNAIIKTMVGGLGVGIIGLAAPHVYGVGYHAMDLALLGQVPWLLMLGLIFVKILATSFSLGSGGSGGVFAPSLFLGAMTGGFFGELMNQLMPGYTASSGAYALVGMAAVVAGATHAPITAILIIFELTNDYKIILPLMISAIIATIITTKTQKESIYTLKLIRRGINLFQGREVNLLKSLRISEVANEHPSIIPANTSLKSILEMMVNSPHTQFFVTDRKDRYLGAVSIHEVRRALLDQDILSDLVIAVDLLNSDLPRVKMEDNLDDAMKLFSRYDSEEFPVVDSNDPDKIIGSVHHKSIIDAYNRELTKRDLGASVSTSVRLLDKIQTVNFIDGYLLAEIDVPQKFIGKTMANIQLRTKYGVNLLMIKRKSEDGLKQIVPTANNKFHEGDRIILMGKKQEIETVKHA